MSLDVREIKPQNGLFKCVLFENPNIGLPLSLFYSIEIPVDKFYSGHEYVPQPIDTDFAIEWIKFTDILNGKQERNWKNLEGNEFELAYENETAEGSIYLGTEHCQFNSIIKFLSRREATFDIELQLAIDFNIEATNLDENGFFSISTSIEYQGLVLYDDNFLPSFKGINDPIGIISDFIDLSVYQDQLTKYDNPHVNLMQLKPRL